MHDPASGDRCIDGIEARAVDVQVQVAPGLPAFNIVGRITVNLAPADLPKEGSHYDLPIALGLMGAIGAIPHDALSGFNGAGRTCTGWLDRSRRGRAAGSNRRKRGPLAA